MRLNIFDILFIVLGFLSVECLYGASMAEGLAREKQTFTHYVAQ